jgi:hypothetical protein
MNSNNEKQLIALQVIFGAGSRAMLAIFGVHAATGVGIVVAALSLIAIVQVRQYHQKICKLNKCNWS